MIREELEFRIARYADGDLSPAERLAVEAELADDAEARALLAEYQTLRTAIEEAAGPALPKVHWDRLEQLLSAAVAKSADGHPADSMGPTNSAQASSPEAAPAKCDESEVIGGPFEALGIEKEFAIACHADGSLSPERRAEVEQLLNSDARAVALFHEYHDLDAATKALAYSDALPVVRWDRLANRISGVVVAGANANLSEDIERQIAAFVEGASSGGSELALPTDESDAVEELLAAEPVARILACEYRILDAALRAVPSVDPTPAVDWERFTGRISAAIDRQAVQTAVRSRKSHEDAYPILKWLRSPTRMAMAASVLIGVALVTRLMHGGPGEQPRSAGTLAPPLEVIVPLSPEGAAGALQSDISIGPPASFAQNQNSDDYAADMGDEDDVVSRPPRALVGRATPHDLEVLPAMPF